MPKSCKFFLMIMILACCLCLSCGEDDDNGDSGSSDDDDDDNDDDDNDDDTSPNGTVNAYYSESEGFDFALVKSRLPIFAQNDLALFLAMMPEHIGDPDLTALLNEAAQLGVEVRSWVVLPYDQGYWPNELNVDEFVEAVGDFADWFATEDFGIEWFIVDMEIDWNQSMAMREMLAEGDIFGAMKLFYNNYDPPAFDAASAKFQGLVDDLSNRGFLTMVVTFPQILDDLADEDTVIQDAMNIPVTTVEWDEVSTMVYSTYFSSLTGMEFGPYLVYDYALDTVARYGDKASIALGLVREMTDPQTLYDEVAAAKSAGIKNIQIFSLEDSMGKDGPDQWHQCFFAEEKVPDSDGATETFRNLLRMIDLLL